METASPDQEVGEGGGDEDPGRPDVVLGVEEAFIRVAGVLAFHVASMVVALWTLWLPEAVPHIILDLNGCQADYHQVGYMMLSWESYTT